MSIHPTINLMAAALSVTGVNLDDRNAVQKFLERHSFQENLEVVPNLSVIIAVAKAKRAEPSMRKFVAMLFGRAA